MTPSPPAARSPASRPLLAVAAGGCVLLLACAVVAAGAGLWYFTTRRSTQSGPPNVEYVLDASPRMLEASDGVTRLSVAQGALAEIVRPASPAVTAGLRVFGTGQLPGACEDTDLLVPLAPANQARISDRLATMPGGAGVDSALGVAVVAAIRDLAATHGPHSLVVVTGGADSCSPQAGELIAQEAGRQRIQLQLFVVGFQVSDSDGVAIKGLVDQTGSAKYLKADSAAELRQTLAAIQTFVDQPNRVTVAQVVATAGAAGGTLAPGGPTPTALNTGVIQLSVLGYAGQPAEGNGRITIQAYRPQDHETPLAIDYGNPTALRLPAGRYDLRLSYDVVLGSQYIGGQVEEWVEGLSVQAGLTTTSAYDMQLGQVDLTVLEAAGKPVPAGNYQFGFRVFHPDDLNSAVAWVIVTGTATLRLAPGSYVLQAAYPGTELVKQDPTARTFEVKAGQSLAYTFDLKLGHLLVEVDDVTGQPIDPGRVTGTAFPAANPDTQFAYSYAANPVDVVMQAGVAYNVLLRLDNGQQLTMPRQQVGEGETRQVKVSVGDFK